MSEDRLALTSQPSTNMSLAPDNTPALRIAQDEARERLEARIQEGNRISSNIEPSSDGLSKARSLRRRWQEYNNQLLKMMFTSSEVADEYSGKGKAAWGMSYGEESIYSEIKRFRQTMEEDTNRLRSILEQLELYPVSHAPELKSSIRAAATNKVFIVHGRDDLARETVARFVAKLGLEEVILHERANAGGTLIEKLERYADVEYAIVLLTPDDEGGLRGTSEYRLRARQNVILELGYFIGKLGRQKVCPMYVEGVELPSDFHGVVYVPLDSNGMWRFCLARELKEAGFDIDLNRAM